jgi:hypothetical protein
MSAEWNDERIHCFHPFCIGLEGVLSCRGAHFPTFNASLARLSIGIGAETDLSNEVPFDFRNRVLGQILVDLSDNPIFYVRMEGMPQIGQGARWGSHDKSFDVARSHQLLHGGSDAMSKSVCLELVPIRRLHTGAAIRPGALEGTTQTIAALLARRRVLVHDHPFGFQIRKLFVTGVAQEERFSAVLAQNSIWRD